MESSPQNKKGKLLYLEVIRIIAIFMVLFIHTGDKGYMFFSTDRESRLYYLYLAISIFVKIAVPLFFMVSGSLLLGKEESIAEIYRKRVLKIAATLLVWSTLYYLYDVWKETREFNLVDYLKLVYSSQTSRALWYLYSYLALLIMLPLLRKMVKLLSNREYWYWIIIVIVFLGICPTVCYLAVGPTFSMNYDLVPRMMATYNIFYFCIGYYFDRLVDIDMVDRTKFRQMIILSVIGIAISAIATTCYVDNKDIPVNDYQVFFHCFRVFPTVTVFLLIKKIFTGIKLSAPVERFILVMGSCTFGIFLMERFSRNFLDFIPHLLCGHIPTFIVGVIWAICSVMFGFAVTWILKKIPFVRYFV